MEEVLGRGFDSDNILTEHSSVGKDREQFSTRKTSLQLRRSPKLIELAM